MAFIDWRDDMSVGVPVLDDDHKVLINLLNEYVDALDNDEGLFVTDTIFTALGQYIDTHFRREEDIMAAAGYPDLKAHKAVHARMEAQFGELRDRILLDPSDAAQNRLKDFLHNWLTDHILKTDMAYKPACSKVARTA
ncbi:bacteriohemerythrin [Novispirillum sp. DQ9]|uniref:bacteriohemerythrin n=1 Tax=Novispirillum sp. DQ9 TaxID=3398612 RepID=UPI003C7A2D98